MRKDKFILFINILFLLINSYCYSNIKEEIKAVKDWIDTPFSSEKLELEKEAP